MKYGIKSQIFVYIYQFDTFSEYKYLNEKEHAIQCDAYKAFVADVPLQGKIPRHKPLYPYLPYFFYGLLFENRLSP
jgi:hypothetical protein